MPTKYPTTIYRSLFSDALRVAWERKALWVFGLFAALLSTGGACEMAAKGFRGLRATRDVYVGMVQGTFTGAHAFGILVQDMLGWDPSRLTVFVSLVVAFGILAVIASVVSQGALIEGAGGKAISDTQAAVAGRASFWHLLALNVLHKAAQLLLILLSLLPMLALVAHATGGRTLAALIAYAIAFPLTIVVSVVFLLASVHSVKTGDHAFDSVHHAVNVFRVHWLAAFETGVLLFGAVILAAFGFVAAVTIASIPFIVVASISLLIGDGILFLIVNMLGATILIVFVFAFAGATTTFQYAVWVKFYEHAGVKNRIISKVRRIWSGK